MPTLSAEQRQVVGKYLRMVMDKIGLRDWEVQITHAPPDDIDHGGECESKPRLLLARFSFRQDVPELPPDEVRRLLLHEAFHPMFSDMREQLTGVEALIGRSATTAYVAALDLWEEQTI